MRQLPEQPGSPCRIDTLPGQRAKAGSGSRQPHLRILVVAAVLCLALCGSGSFCTFGIIDTLVSKPDYATTRCSATGMLTGAVLLDAGLIGGIAMLREGDPEVGGGLRAMLTRPRLLGAR